MSLPEAEEYANKPLRGANYIAVILFLLIMVGPLVFYQAFYASKELPLGGETAAATVALGAVFRSNGRNLLKSTFMSAVRTALRTIIRRIVRMVIPIVLRLFLPIIQTKMRGKSQPKPQQPLAMALTLGLFALSASFYGVIALSPSESKEGVLFGFSLPVCAILAASALLIHYGLLSYFSQRENTQIRLETTLEGVLLQAYFTGALSYLPLASDLNIEGTVEQKARCAAKSLLGLILLSLSLDTLGHLFYIPFLYNWGAHLLLYAFVVSFPLAPLDGSDIWRHNRRWWFGIFALILLSFLLNMPETFYEIL
ncbi:MAG: hypothetical protein VX278_05815 [Myxococcota bacterium]|nr:hypothetical protein [Myxococcota bacterium]